VNGKALGRYFLSVILLLAVGNSAWAESVPREAQKHMNRGMAAVEMSKSPAENEAAIPNKSAEREWLIMVYMSGVNDLGILGYVDKNINAMENVNFTNKVSVVVHYNAIRADENKNLQFQSDSETLHIRHDSDINKVTSLHILSKYNSDMGDGDHLSRFVIPNIIKFPAKKTMLIIWGQGDGHRGIAYDDVSGNKITVNQLGLALADITKTTGRRLDIFATDASFMQMASVAYEIKDYAKVIVGSEESIPGQGYPYKSILTDLNGNPEMDARELGNIIVRDYGDYYSDTGITVSTVRNYMDSKYIGGTTISAVDTTLMPQFVKLLNNWVSTITSSASDLNEVAKLAMTEDAFCFGSLKVVSGRGTRSIDLCDLIDHIDHILPDGSQAKEAGEILRNFVTNKLIISHRGTGTKRGTSVSYNTRTFGLSVYMPKRIDSGYNALVFARDSLWDDFIRGYLK